MPKYWPLVAALALLVPQQSFAAAPQLGGPLGVPTPLFPASNWWNTDVSAAPLDPGSAAFISHIGGGTPLHPDLGGATGPTTSYGIPYVVVDGTQLKRSVNFLYWDESDGNVSSTTHNSDPVYPIPDEAILNPYWIEGGQPGNANVGGDRHMLIVDRDNNRLYELYALKWNGSMWTAGSGAIFNMATNTRRPVGWTSADAAGLAILPGLLRYDEATGSAEIGHAFRFTVQNSNGYVFPASHTVNSVPGALPMGTRLRLKAGKDISTFSQPVQRIFRAMKKYGLIVADQGSNMYITGTYDPNWNSLPLNGPFGQLTANDFEVVKLGWEPTNASIDDASITEGPAGGSKLLGFTVTLSPAPSQTVTVNYATVATGSATAGSDFVAKSGTLTFAPGQTTRAVVVSVLGDGTVEPDETFSVTLSSPVNATIVDGTAIGTITNDDPAVAATMITQYRLYYGVTAEHMYTSNLVEYNALGAAGWIQEGPTYRTFSNGGTYNGAYTIPFYRLYNTSSKQHHWTQDPVEVTSLAGQAAWSFEGVSTYVLGAAAGTSVPLYRLVYPAPLVHVWTIDVNERNGLTTLPNKWVYEGVTAHVLPYP